jgi:hypothetical protein
VVDLDDPEPRGEHSGNTVHFGYLPLFGPGGPHANDVRQGQLGDCWWMSTIASVAHNDPDRIESLITDNRDGTYTVHFPDGDVTVDDEFTVDASGRPRYAQLESGALWPLVLEKAMAERKGGDYDDINGDRSYRGMEALDYEADRIPLNPAFGRDPSDNNIVELIDETIAAGMPITVRSDGAFGYGGSHALTVLGTETGPDGKDYVRVRNPWGHHGTEPPGTDDFADPSDLSQVQFEYRTGVMLVPIDVFTANFDHFDVGSAR